MTTVRHEPAPELLGILRCPETGAAVAWAGDALVTAGGERSYPLLEGVPILVAESRSLFSPADVRGRAGAGAGLRGGLRRRLTSSPASRANFERLARLLRGRWREGDDPLLVLVVGGGILGFGAEALLDRPWIELVDTDVYIGPRTRVVCDAHDLPFADGAFAAVVCQAVLEHVADPVRVVAELHRVLADDGLLYSEIPFMQQVHEGAYDFTRWTLTGHRRLLRDFGEISAGAVGGPGESLAWSLRYLALALAGESAVARRILGQLTLVATLPLRALDRLLRDRPAALDGASGTFFLGRARGQPRSDADIVAAHRGAIASPGR
jgi:SAM-dependent methyltransferase